MLPRSADSNGLVAIKLKCKLTYRDHAYFEAVRPELLNQALISLRENNSLYSDVSVDVGNTLIIYYHLPMMIFQIQLELVRTQKKLKIL